MVVGKATGARTERHLPVLARHRRAVAGERLVVQRQAEATEVEAIGVIGYGDIRAGGEGRAVAGRGVDLVAVPDDLEAPRFVLVELDRQTGSGRRVLVDLARRPVEALIGRVRPRRRREPHHRAIGTVTACLLVVERDTPRRRRRRRADRQVRHAPLTLGCRRQQKLAAGDERASSRTCRRHG